VRTCRKSLARRQPTARVASLMELHTGAVWERTAMADPSAIPCLEGAVSDRSARQSLNGRKMSDRETPILDEGSRPGH